MKLFVKILLVVFIAFVANIKVASATITFTNIQEITTSFPFYKETQETVFKSVENDLRNCCQNEQDLVAYRDWGIGIEAVAAKTGLKYSDDLVKAAQKLYPNKAGKIELHHPIPQYLGGAKNQTLVPLDAAYHQVITNEFRRIHGYGLAKPSPQRLQEIMNQVYSKYPMP